MLRTLTRTSAPVLPSSLINVSTLKRSIFPPKGPAGAYAELVDSRARGRYRLHVRGLQSLLEQVELMARATTRARGGTEATTDDTALLLAYRDLGLSLDRMRALRDVYVNLAHPPVSTALQVSRLFQPVFLVEVEAIAIVGQS